MAGGKGVFGFAVRNGVSPLWDLCYVALRQKKKEAPKKAPLRLIGQLFIDFWA